MAVKDVFRLPREKLNRAKVWARRVWSFGSQSETREAAVTGSNPNISHHGLQGSFATLKIAMTPVFGGHDDWYKP